MYRVAHDPETLEIDYDGTERMRHEERKKRKARGKRYEEFEKEWLSKKPAEEALTFYGTWPDGAAVAPVVRI